MKPQFLKLPYTYKKPDADVWVLNTHDIPVDANLIKDQQIVHLGPQSVGGNHKHPRTEWFIGIGDLLFIWVDETGVKHEQSMNPNGEIILITVPPNLPHAVVNQSKTKEGIIYEMADAKMGGVEKVNVI